MRVHGDTLSRSILPARLELAFGARVKPAPPTPQSLTHDGALKGENGRPVKSFEFSQPQQIE